MSKDEVFEVDIDIDSDTLECLETIAETRGISLNSLITEILRDAMNKELKIKDK